MSVAPGASAKGIVSLYNKGFVPQKTGKVSKKSMFSGVGTLLYETAKDNEEQLAMAARLERVQEQQRVEEDTAAAVGQS